ncbi:PQQ-dependent sugar dehydrogenase [Knoellia sp. Soil729]|uniref:PQQ-dependent sugar dehydrogenase n=1 Tax=Knoellia sp. Soil729 TaxID=1736394 RepID=UPI0006F92B1B|nr:PQQ-dependent sugar dehydrogenase [Knoellia sp. Soil729]KRE43627.1 glucose sorbosone dehydrogenase [Knoellia sp. Soil729]
MPSAHLARRPLVLATAAALALSGCTGNGTPSSTGPTEVPTTPAASPVTPTGSSSSPSSPSPTPSLTATASQGRDLPTGSPSDVITGLDVPWSIAFLPDGDALVTLRDSGEVLRVSPTGERSSLGKVDGVDGEGEGGLLGVAVSPSFATDATVHLYLTASHDNRVVRTTLGADGFGPMTPVLTGIPKASNHNGGRIKWGPDGFLYVGTGDAGQSDRSQDRDDLGGKILRVTADGKAAPGNPFGASPVWSLGHRNVQGLAWGADGTMFASEFGQNTWDELNVIVPGKNYGWPQVEGIEDSGGDFVPPIAQWATSDSSPSGITVGPDGAVYLAALRGASLWKVAVDGRRVRGEPVRLLHNTYGRIRDVATAPDGSLWILSNNTFRGDPRTGDDRIVRVPIGSGP